MKWRMTIAATVAAQLVTFGSAHAQTVNNFGQYVLGASSGIYFTGGVAILKRSTPDYGAFIASNPGSAPFLSANQLKFDWSSGFDGTIGFRIAPRQAFEVRYLQINSDAANFFVSPGAFIGVGFTGPSGTTFNTTYETNFQSWEFNWRYSHTDHLSILAGYRTISIRDGLRTKLNGNVATGFYDYKNSMQGAQIGLDWSVLPKANPFQINLIGKIGVLRNEMHGGINEFQANNYIGGFHGSARENVLVGEAGVTFGYRINNHVLLRAGYQVLVMEDVALASNNAAGSLLNPSLLRTNVYQGTLVYQGANFGVTINW